jgi:hypothetical protein
MYAVLCGYREAAVPLPGAAGSAWGQDYGATVCMTSMPVEPLGDSDATQCMSLIGCIEF